MISDAWARTATWSPEEQERFERRLRRMRRRTRARLIWLKAIALLDAEDEPTRAAGRELMRRLVAEYPGALVDLSWAHALLGDACERDGLDEEAEVHYRRCAQLERDPDGLYSGCDLRLAELIVRNERDDLYAEADGLLDELERLERRRLTGAGHRYRHAVVRARLCARLGREREAGCYATAALALALEVGGARPDSPRVPRPADLEIAFEMRDLIEDSRALYY